MTLNPKNVEKLRHKYQMHPLLFQRCLDYAKNDVELFDILDTMPKEFPITWDEKTRRFIHIDNVYFMDV